MRKSIRIIAITVYLLLIATSLFAEWEQLNPRIAGGTLSARWSSNMVSMGNGRILLFGGYNNSSQFGDMWIFEINKNRWMRITPTMIPVDIAARRCHGMAYLDRESVLLYGGYSSYSDTWIYNSTTNSFTRLSPTVVGGSLGGLHSMGLCYIDEGSVLLFGGQNADSTRYNNTWIYDSRLNQWQLMTPTIVGEGFNARSHIGMAYIGNGRALMFGGADGGSTYINSTWVYDLAQNQWTRMTPVVVGPAGNSLTGRVLFGMTYIGGDRVLLFGGRLNPSNQRTNEVWMYDLSDNQWTYLADLASSARPVAREAMAFASAGLGQVVMFGGLTGTALGDTWRFSIPDNVQDSVAWQIVPSALQLSWSLPADFAGAQFSIDRDGVQISPSVAPGPPANGLIPYVYLDHTAAPGMIYRYRINESYPVMNSQLLYPEIAVPYCQ